MKPGELSHLSNPMKPFSWVFASDGLFCLSQCTDHYQMCIRLGFERDWMEMQLLNGNVFSLYLFPESSKDYTAVCATWSGVFHLLESEEPEIYAKLEPFRSELIDCSFEDIESKSDCMVTASGCIMKLFWPCFFGATPAVNDWATTL